MTRLRTDVDVGICLNVVNVLAVKSKLMTATLNRAHNSRSYRVTQFERTSDGNDKLTRTKLAGVTERQRRQLCLSHAHNTYQMTYNKQIQKYHGPQTGRHCCIRTRQMSQYSAGGSTFLHEMTSWMPAWKCDFKSKSWSDLKWQS